MESYSEEPRIAKIKWNDCVNGNGIVVSVFFQGCDKKCPFCQNPETWSYDSSFGEVYTKETEDLIIEGLNKNGIHRNLSILGGEPFSTRNLKVLNNLIKRVKRQLLPTEIIIWTGNTLEELIELNNTYIDSILNNIDYLIDGKFDINTRDITLKWRGSPNQRILSKEDIKKGMENNDNNL